MTEFNRRTNDIEVHERLAAIETNQDIIKSTVIDLDTKLFGNGQPGLVEIVNRHKTYWKITKNILVILLTASAGAGVAFALGLI